MIAESLLAVSAKLKGLSTSTEQDFLTVGGKLEGIVIRAREKADALVDLLNRAEGEHGQGLSEALEQVTAWAREAGQEAGDEQSLGSLLRIVRAVNIPLWNLKNAVQILRAMGVAMRVESSRLDSQASDFEALAREVGSLAVSVDKKADAILDAVDVLIRLLERTHSTALRLGRQQQRELIRLMAECSAGLADLRAEHSALADVSRNSQAGFQRVVTDIGRLVVNLQFHDSTRQRIEHVEEALTRLAADCGHDAPEASGAVHILELQAAQLNDASRSFQTTVGQVRADLQEIGETAGSFACMARELSHNRAGGSHPMGGSAGENHFSKVGAAVAEWSASRRTLGEAAQQAHQACSHMSGLVAEVETVGRHMFRLALNAEIQAFQMNSSGAVMVAVADNIRAVSRDASANAASVSHALREVQTSAAGLTGALGGTETDQTQQAEIMAAQVQEAASELRVQNAESRRALESIANDGDTLAQEIADLQVGITADRVMNDVVTTCLGSLEDVATTARQTAGDPDAEQHAAMLHDALRSYTMHAEREVHESLLGGAIQAKSASRFGGAASSLEPVAALASLGDTGLGANVELF